MPSKRKGCSPVPVEERQDLTIYCTTCMNYLIGYIREDGMRECLAGNIVHAKTNSMQCLAYTPEDHNE